MGGSAGLLVLGLIMIGGALGSSVLAFLLFFWFTNSVGPHAALPGLAVGIVVAILVVLPVWPTGRWPIVLTAIICNALALVAVLRNRHRRMRAAFPAAVLLVSIIVVSVLLLRSYLPEGSLFLDISALAVVLAVSGAGGLSAFALYCLCHKPLKTFGVMNDAV